MIQYFQNNMGGAEMREYYVAKTGNDSGCGSKENPFLTISKAAEVAMSGDKVIVHEGVYREWVKPTHGGRNNSERIVYQAAEGEKVVIKGSERIENWQQVEGNVWKVVLSESFFGNYNPYRDILSGDWLIWPKDRFLHPGEVYMNGKAFYEAASLDEVKNPVKRETGAAAPWTKREEALLHPEDSIYQWFAEVDDEYTTIYANFQGKNPNEEETEINVRKCCFYPEKTGRNYITVRGFEIAQAASPWTPPTADQPGMVGTNWSKGWVIEDNIIHDAKCSGISIGKEASTGHNLCTRLHRKPGYQYQMEAVFRARQIGWSKETIGSHVIQNNTIYDCGQNGVVGHMGCVFSTIRNNHIYNIGAKHEYFGYEIAGIKLHAAIDVCIEHNRIHDSSLGTWLDWQAQGTRVSKNLYYRNDRDFMIEVTHGPYVVDNNIFASDYNFDNIAQGGLYIHNLCCGTMRREPVLDRSTPYHFPHTTEVAGSALVYSGDDRFFQNIFLGGAPTYTEQSKYGTDFYNGHPESMEEYIHQIVSKGNGDHEQFDLVKQPVYMNGNAYLEGAKPYEKEQNCYVKESGNKVCIKEDGENGYLEINVDKEMLELATKVYASSEFEPPRITEAAYENPDGSSIIFDTDYKDVSRGVKPVVGPFAELSEGVNRIQIW